jgi:hypothetical protein
MKSFHDEFVFYCRSNGYNDESIPRISTFKSVFKKQSEVKLAGCKGHFSSCEICNNANDLLRDKGFSKILYVIYLKIY